VIFVLGGLGFVGSAMVRRCQAKGVDAVAVDRDNYAEYVGQRCDILINANGNSSKLLGRSDPLGEFDASVRSVRASLIDFRFELYVHLSSGDVYPDCSDPAHTKEDAAIEVKEQSTYGFHKYLAEQCVRHGAADWLIFRLGGMVGPGMRKNAIFDILSGGPLWLDPASELQYACTADVAEMVFGVIDSGRRQEIFNLGGRGVIALADVMRAAGAVAVTPGSPRIHHELNLEKAAQVVSLPRTSDTVLEFVAAAARGRQPANDRF
jgi:nucleoside-diphosphate-sugar epimerase